MEKPRKGWEKAFAEMAADGDDKLLIDDVFEDDNFEEWSSMFFKPFSELTSDELYDILRLRAEIFVVEQDCVYNDLDGLDKAAVHQFIKKENKILAYSRLLKPGTRFPDCSIGRVVVMQSERGKGLGIALIQAAIKYIAREWGTRKIKISAQKYLRKFYEDLGFEIVTEEYLEDGIPHFGMMYNSTTENP